MPTDPESDNLAPMLSQSTDDVPASDDNLPMISGRGTRIIVRARGAYHAGNLLALIERMTEEQQLRFRQVLVRQMLDRCNIFGPLNEDFPLDRGLRIVAQWLDSPTPDTTEQFRSLMQESGHFRVVEYNERVHLHPETHIAHRAGDVLLALEYPLPAASRYVISTYQGHFGPSTLRIPFDTDDVDPGEWIAKRWLVDVAWAIISKREIRTMESFEAEGTLGNYHRGDLTALIRQMNDRQKFQFRQALMLHVLRYVERLDLEGDVYANERRILDASRRWLDAPTPAHAREIEALLKGQPFGAEKQEGVQGAVFALGAIASGNLMMVTFGARWALEQAAWARFGPSRTVPRETSRWWQMETAWAILQGTEPPAMEIPYDS